MDQDEAAAYRCGCGQELDCCGGEHCPRCGCPVPLQHAVTVFA